jgi:gamma-glutamylcyclotransferase (GGCT)/AIG2-like uncharacterized protein YtfP
MNNLFTYGSLMCSDIMFKVAGCRADFTPAILLNFFRSRIINQEYPGIVPQSGTTVPGVLYLNLSTEAIKRLDAFEGELYRREEIEVITETYNSVTAMTYVIKPQHSTLLTNEEWSFSSFLSSGKKKFEQSYLGFQDL